MTVTMTPVGGRSETSMVDTLRSPRIGVSTVDLTDPAANVIELRERTGSRIVAWLGGLLCPPEASSWRVARRAGLAGLGLVPVELLVGVARQTVGGTDVHLSLAGVAVVAAASPLILAVTAAGAYHPQRTGAQPAGVRDGD